MGWYETHVFNRLMDGMLDTAGMHEERTRVLAPATGEILELGIGTGLNLPWYPSSVARVTAVGPDVVLDRRARERASARRLTVDYASGDARALPFDAARFDTVVATLVFCTIPEPARAIAEAVRVLKPGGAFLFFEHVVRPHGWVRGFQRAFDPVNRLLGCGCSLVRNTGATLAAAGFAELALEEREGPLPLPAAWVICGRATR